MSRGDWWTLAGIATAAAVVVVAIVAGGSMSGAASDSGGRSAGQAAAGGVNTGLPGSRCAARTQSSASPAEPGTQAGRFRGDYYELGEPAQGGGAAPLMLIIHGGGWVDNGPGQVAAFRHEADVWRAAGWRTLNLDYHACAKSIDDVVAFYDRFRQLATGHSICAEGSSAGGQLALMLAAGRPRIRCVIGLAAPTDLPALGGRATSAAGTLRPRPSPTSGTRYIYGFAVAAFGARQLPAQSPALHAKQITARVLLAGTDDDVYVPLWQAQEFAQRHSGTTVLRLPPGRVPWGHGTTTPQGVQHFYQAERELAAGLG